MWNADILITGCGVNTEEARKDHVAILQQLQQMPTENFKIHREKGQRPPSLTTYLHRRE